MRRQRPNPADPGFDAAGYETFTPSLNVPIVREVRRHSQGMPPHPSRGCVPFGVASPNPSGECPVAERRARTTLRLALSDFVSASMISTGDERQRRDPSTNGSKGVIHGPTRSCFHVPPLIHPHVVRLGRCGPPCDSVWAPNWCQCLNPADCPEIRPIQRSR